MTLRRRLAVALIGGLALVGAPGQAMAETATHDFRIVKLGANPGTVIALGPLYPFRSTTSSPAGRAYTRGPRAPARARPTSR
jgi:hypothetical protein